MKVFGLIGEKLSHSLSPVIHQYLYDALGINATYSLYEVEGKRLPAAVDGMRALSISGLNVTIPYKVRVMDLLDAVSEEALKIGAVNTIANNAGQLTGYNTDYLGFGRLLLRNAVDVKGKAVVILGSGGAAKSVAAYLENNTAANIKIVTRDPMHISGFDSDCNDVIDYSQLAAIENCDILVNCTPVGMYPHTEVSPIPCEVVSKFKVVVDLIYNPSKTLLLRHAEEVGAAAYNGLYMLVAQAAAAVEIWNNLKIEDAVVENVYKKLEKYLSQ